MGKACVRLVLPSDDDDDAWSCLTLVTTDAVAVWACQQQSADHIVVLLQRGPKLQTFPVTFPVKNPNIYTNWSVLCEKQLQKQVQINWRVIALIPSYTMVRIIIQSNPRWKLVATWLTVCMLPIA